MTETLQGPVVEPHERHHLAADAFLFAALVFLVGIGLQELLAALVTDGPSGTPGPVWLELVGAVALPVAVLGGPLLAWRVHGRGPGWRDVLAAVLASLLGSVVLGLAFTTLFLLLRLLPSFRPQDEGPWDLVAIVTIAVVALLARPVLAAVRDLTGARRHARRDTLRLGALTVMLAAVVISLFVGGEGAELGLFLAMPAAVAALAVAAMDWWRSRRVEAA